MYTAIVSVAIVSPRRREWWRASNRGTASTQGRGQSTAPLALDTRVCKSVVRRTKSSLVIFPTGSLRGECQPIVLATRSILA